MVLILGVLKLIRWSNLIMLWFAQFLFFFIVFPKTIDNYHPNHFVFCLLNLSTLFIAAGGYIINDVLDIDCDKINKPDKSFIPSPVSLKSAKTLYVLFSVLGLILSTILCIEVSKPEYILLFIGIISSLYLYSKYFQRLPFIGNLIISILVGLNTYILHFFINFPSRNSVGLQLLFQFSFFAFFINLIREIVKDIQDIDGDYNSKMKTLPIILGIERTKKTIYFLCLIPTYLMIRFCTDMLNSPIDQIVFICTIICPLFYFFYKLKESKSKKEFSFLNKLLKGILIFGLLLLLLISSS